MLTLTTAVLLALAMGLVALSLLCSVASRGMADPAERLSALVGAERLSRVSIVLVLIVVALHVSPWLWLPIIAGPPLVFRFLRTAARDRGWL